MDYLNLSRKALAWHFIQDPKTLIATFEQWLAFLNDGQKGILRVINLTNAMRLIIDAMELAKEHSADVSRFCDDVAAGRAPFTPNAIILLNDPDSSERLEYWAFEMTRYVEFFNDHLLLAAYMRDPENRRQKALQEPSGQIFGNSNLMSPEQVSLILMTRNIKIAPKTLKNTYKAGWGKPDGREGNAELFDWERIRPIVEEQFKVIFSD